MANTSSTPVNTQKGQALILLTLAVVGLFALVALAIDAGNSFSDRRKAQNAVDSAAMAAALAKSQNQDATSAATARATSNGFTTGVNGATVTVNDPAGAGCNGANGSYAGLSGYVQVIIRSRVSAYFGSIVGIPQSNNCAEAIARTYQRSGVGATGGDSALYIMDPDSATMLEAASSNDLIIQGGNIFVNSYKHDAAKLTSTGDVITVNGNTLMVGGYKYSNVGRILPDPITGVPARDDPLAAVTPPGKPGGACLNIAWSGSGDIVLNPGCYSQIKASSGRIFLNPGIYYINGSQVTASNAGIIGNGVMLFMKNGEIKNSGSGYMQLSAPTSGPWQGMVIFFDRANNSKITITGNSSTTYTGTIYAIASDIELTGSGESDTLHSCVVVRHVKMTGSSSWTIDYKLEENYPMGMNVPIIELTR